MSDQAKPAHKIIVAVGSSRWLLPAEREPAVANFFDLLRVQGTPVVSNFDADAWRKGGSDEWENAMWELEEHGSWIAREPRLSIEFGNGDIFSAQPPKEAKE